MENILLLESVINERTATQSESIIDDYTGMITDSQSRKMYRLVIMHVKVFLCEHEAQTFCTEVQVMELI